MKKLILSISVLTSALLADVSTVLPYAGSINYGSNNNKSVKDKANLYGFHYSIGNLSYLLDFDYSHIKTKYKNSATPDLKQDDVVLTYSKFYPTFMYKLGLHTINTTDKQLDNGWTIITGIGGYKFYGYNKLTYGIDGYYSSYKDGHDENYVAKKVKISQVTPYISYYKALSLNLGNTVTAKLNYQHSSNFVKKSYTSYEFSDTIFYKKTFTTFKFYGGKMRTGIKDGGFVVYNTLDLMKNGYGVKFGYHLSKKTTLSISYDSNTYREFDQSGTTITDDNTNSVIVASIGHTF